MRGIILILIGLFIFASCEDQGLPTPKPRMYPRVKYPVKEFGAFKESYCQFSFSQPLYAKVKKEEYYFEGKPLDPCWFDLEIKALNTTIHCSYYPINKPKDFEDYVNDAFKLTGKHNVRAEYIDEILVDNQKGVTGILFELTGPVASPLQFFLTDSTSHFFRGSVYFNSEVNRDSILPVYDFVKEDVLEMIETFEWK